MTLRLKNESEYIGKKGQTNWWKWTVFLEADNEKELDDVQFVIYHLHSTFTPPIVKVTIRTGGFPLTRKGWGTFVISAKVVFKSKKDPLILENELEFQNIPISAPRKP